ncbi:hypothetical protein MTR_8g094750 [Medicago truncatula]|uniref:Uncharacterized protein n=1 Tax=Medicago truncatula TaxID=3880 RepID=G7LFP3_MEDTR|nr:hypothetical protein MTR_8g094750 [Medicago truncatula]
MQAYINIEKSINMKSETHARACMVLTANRKYQHGFYGVVVSTLDFESSDLGSTPGRTFFLYLV